MSESTLPPAEGILDEIYEKAELGGRVGFGSSKAILVVDFQKCFVDPTIPGGADFSEAIKATRRLLDTGRAEGTPIYFTVTEYQPDLSDAGLFIRKCPSLRFAVTGTENVEVDDRLDRRSDEPRIVKQFASGFHGTDLADQLSARGIDTVIVCGCTTSGCVRASVVDALQNGFRAIVPRECVADIAIEPHQASLFDMDQKYGDVVSLDEVLAVFS